MNREVSRFCIRTEIDADLDVLGAESMEMLREVHS